MIHFCKNCKHFSKSWKGGTIEGVDLNSIQVCRFPTNTELNIEEDKYVYKYKQTPQQKNANNNCKNFEPTLIYTIKRFFFKCSED